MNLTHAQLVAVLGAAVFALILVLFVAIVALRQAQLTGKVDVLLRALSVEYEEDVRRVGPVPVHTDYRLKGRLSDEQLYGFGLQATPSQRLAPRHSAPPQPVPAPLHPYAVRPENRTPPPDYGDSWPPLGYATAVPNSRGFGSHGPASQRRMSGGPGPNSRGLYPQDGR